MRNQALPPGRSPGADDPFRPYVPYAEGFDRDEPQRRGRGARRQRFPRLAAMFHVGNAGHFWRGEMFSRLGDALLIPGVLLWVTYLTFSPRSVALVVVLIALPSLLVGPFAAPLQNVTRPARLFRLVGQGRVLGAVGLVGLQLIHYRGIFPNALHSVLYLLVFTIALCGQLREALRVAAARACLAPGDLELIANDLQIGGALVAVVGPLLAALFFLLLGERILLIAIVAAVIYFVGANSDGLLEALPVGMRAFALAKPELVIEDEQVRADLLAAAQERQPGSAALSEEEQWLQNEGALPEWYQFGPRSIWQGVADLREGLGQAARSNSSRTSLYILASLALISGGLTVLEVFYLIYVVQAPLFYLGPLLAAEAAGLALGGMMAARSVANGSWRRPIVLGLCGSGLALALWGAQPLLLVVLPAALLLGTASGMAVTGARYGLRAGYDGPQRRALTAAETCVTSLCALIGAGIFVYFYLYLSPTYLNVQGLVQSPILARFNLTSGYTSWGLNELFLFSGLLLIFLSLPFGMNLFLGGVGPPRKLSSVLSGLTGRSRAFPAAGGLAADDDGWDDDEDVYAPRYAAYTREETGYARGYESENGRGYGSAARSARDHDHDDGDGDDGRW